MEVPHIQQATHGTWDIFGTRTALEEETMSNRLKSDGQTIVVNPLDRRLETRCEPSSRARPSLLALWVESKTSLFASG